MSRPYISVIEPASIWTGGQLITVTGGNFQTWVIPSTSSGVLPPPTPTVSVTVDGVACTNVAVFSATRLTCFAPAHDAGVSAVVVTNVDEDGVAIVDENSSPATLTYLRPDLTAAQDLERLNEQVILALRRQVLDNVLTFVSVDYSEEPFEVTALGKLPALILSGPTIVESDGVYMRNAEVEVEYNGTEFVSYRPPHVVNLQYELTGMTDNTRQLVNLQVATRKFFERNIRISILRDPNDASKGYMSYDLEKPIGVPLRATTVPNKDDVRSFDMSFQVVGVPIEGLGGFTDENLIGRGGVVDQVVTTSVKI